MLVPAGLLTGDLDGITETFEVNTLGSLRTARAFAPILAAHGGGALVNTHSVLSWLAGSGAYGASKAAAWSVTNSLRLELAGQHTQVLGAHAGFIDTDMVAAIPRRKATPAEIAARIVDGLEAGDTEVLADADSVAVKTALSGPVEGLTLAAVG